MGTAVTCVRDVTELYSVLVGKTEGQTLFVKCGMILKWVLGKQEMMVRTGFVWLNTHICGKYF